VSQHSDFMSAESPGRVLYLIFSHENQAQVVRLAGAIRQLSANALIVIHHDPSKEVFEPATLLRIPGMRLIPNPLPGEWGDYSLVEQYLHALRWCRNNAEFEWLCTLTGLSYPLVRLGDFERMLLTSEYHAFVRYFDAFDPGPYPKGVWPRGTGETRYLFRYFKLPRFRHYYLLPTWVKSRLAAACEALNLSSLIRIAPLPRGARTRVGVRRMRLPFDNDFKIYAGRQMLNLNVRALDKVLAFVDSHPQYEAFFRRTLIPDESFFVSILANDRDLNVRNDVQRFILWPKGIGASSVGVITAGEVDIATRSGAPFGLKFDTRVAPDALDLLDSMLGIIRWDQDAESLTAVSTPPSTNH